MRGLSIFRALILIGFLLTLIGFMILFLASFPAGGAMGSGAIIVLIGPFPFAVGFGEYSPMLILIGIVAAAVMILLTFMSLKYIRKRGNNSGSEEV